MDLTNILILVSAAVIILLLWGIVGVRHLKRLRKEVSDQWGVIYDALRKRQDIVPNLIETVRAHKEDQEELFKGLIKDRMNAAKEQEPGEKKIELEYDLSKAIDAVFALEKDEGELASDTNFLELKKEIDDLERSIEDQSKKYNEMVRLYDKHRRLVFLKPVAAIFGFEMVNIFEVEI